MRKGNILPVFPLLLTMIISTVLSTQGQSQFKRFGSKEGYYGIGFPRFNQDSLGFLWIRTSAGLYRFDGYDFKIYRSTQNDPLGFPLEGYGSLTSDPFGNLCIYDDHLRLFDRNHDRFITYPFDTEITSVFFESNKEIVWLGIRRKGLYRFNLKLKETKKYFNSQDKSSNFSANQIRQIVDCNTFFLLSTEDGLWKFEKASSSYIRLKYNLPYTASNHSTLVNKIFPHKTYYWLCTDNGLIQTDSALNVTQSFNFQTLLEKQTDRNQRTLSISEIDQDSNGVFWIADQALGLFSYDPKKNETTNFRNNPRDEFSLPSDLLVSLKVDRDQNIWLASYDKGIIRVVRPSVYFHNYFASISVSATIFLSGKTTDRLVACTETNGIWISSIKADGPQSLEFHSLNDQLKGIDIICAAKGQNMLWIGTHGGGVKGFEISRETGMIGRAPSIELGYTMQDLEQNNPNKILSNRIAALYDDNHGNLWAGSAEGGDGYAIALNKVNLSIPYGTAGSVFHYQHNDLDSNSISLTPIISGIIPENENDLWLVTGKALDLLRNKRFEHIVKNIATRAITKTTDGTILLGTKSGLYEGKVNGPFRKVDLLKNNFVCSIREDKSGKIWIATMEGLFCWDRKAGWVQHFKTDDGLAAEQPSLGTQALIQLPGGLMVLSGQNGISVFNPESVKISNATAKPFFTQLKINNTPVILKTSESSLAPEDLVLDYAQNVFFLEFAAMQLTAPQNNNYRHKLQGFDQEWIETDWKNRTATYTNLDPGEYIFKVKASNQDGVWSNMETNLKIQILPPPWKTWWAYLFYTLIFAGLLALARRSIVQRERLTLKMNLKNMELEKARELDRLKTSFFTNISHEFRTPLTLIKGPTETLLEEYSSNPKAINNLNRIQQNADHLLKLINQLLELARMESGNIKIELAKGNLKVFLNRTAQSFSSHAAQKGIRYNIEIDIENVVAEYDHRKLEAIILNLIGNALKFTKTGGSVLFRAGLEKKYDGAQVLQIKVADTGIGISKSELDHIFERFYQVNSTHHEPGTGIGLAVVKELTEILGGTIQVFSQPAKGSEFVALIPIEITAFSADENAIETDLNNSVEVNKQDELGQEMNSKPKILVVEDNDDLRRYIIESLGDTYEYLEAENGKVGLDLALLQIPELIISDVMMPEMDGMVMTNSVKKDLRTNHIPVIMLTAKANEQDKLAGLQAGADDYITKPFNRNEVILKVKNSLALQLRMQKKLRREIERESMEPDTISHDDEFLIKVKSAIISHLSNEQLSVETLAKEMAMSRVQLYRKVSAVTGMSVIALIREYRLQYAAKKLQAGARVSEVAFEIGFSNHSHFSRIFKEKFGMMPSEYPGDRNKI